MGEACQFEPTFQVHMTSFQYVEEKQALHPWFALKVRVGSEARTVELLTSRGLHPFAPTQQERRRYSDRMKNVAKPVFPGYVFCSFDIEKKLSVISCPGVDYIVGFGSVATAIPEAQIEGIRRIVAEGGVACEHFAAGDRVRVTHGALSGVEGILVQEATGNRLVVSIDLLNRGASLLVNKDHVTRLDSAA